MKITKRELKNYEILQLFNEFVKNLNTEGLNPKYSLMLYKNIEALNIPYNNIIGAVYNEANDTEYQKYQHDLNDTIVKYADRDEQGNIIQNESGVSIKEQIVEFNAAKEALDNVYKDALERVAHKDENNRKVETATQEVELVVLDLNEFPDKAKPFVVGLLTA